MPLDSQASVIEKGIPVPPRARIRYSELDRFVEKMEVGDSVLPERIGLKAAAFAHWSRRRNNGIRFTIRKTREGYRVWRVA